MSTLKLSKIQLGNHPTLAANNFVLDTDVAGALRVRRGNLEAPGAEVFKINAKGEPRFANTPQFKARLAPASGFTSNTVLKVSFPSEEYDIGDYYNAANSRWIPPAGRYYVGTNLSFSGPGLPLAVGYVFVNGAQVDTLFDQRLQSGSTTTNMTGSGGTPLVLNGTDFVEISIYSAVSSGTVTVGGVFYGHYIGG